MASQSKPPLTGSSHPLPFEKLSPLDFERLCLWLVQREGFTRAEHLGEAGSEGGRDVVAWKDDRRFVFQCKRVQAFTAAHAKKEIKKLRELPADEQPAALVFVVSRAVSADARKEIRDEWGDEETCQFWAGSELDERVKRHPEIVAEFFQLPTVRRAPLLPHNLPFPSLGPLFQGREEMVALLRERLTQTSASRATAIAGKAVHGLGGVGKTRLAVEYAWRYASEYTALLFVGAESRAAMRRNLAVLCDRMILDLPEQEAKEEEIREVAALRWLGDQSGWLLILDNVDSEDAAEAVDALVANLHGGHVLLTGRLARWGTGIEEIELDVLAEEDAAGFLLARTEKKRRRSPEDASLAVTLARELGFLPLALEQAGAYIAERRLTFAAYLEEWKSKHDAVLNWFDPRVSRYPASVATTWQTSFDRLSAPARRLLERLAWLGPEPIPEMLLDVPVPESPEEEDPRDALVELASYSLVTQDDETPSFTVHRLVQDVTRQSVGVGSVGESLMEALGGALRWMDTGFAGDFQDARSWSFLDSLTSHAHSVILHVVKLEITIQLAQVHEAKQLFDWAELLTRRMLEANKLRLGPQHLTIAVDLNNLALLFIATNRLSEAEPLLAQVVMIVESRFGEDHPTVADSLEHLALLLLKVTNRLNEAEPLMRRRVSILRNLSQRTGHAPGLREALVQYALVLRRMDKSDEEIKAALEALLQPPK